MDSGTQIHYRMGVAELRKLFDTLISKGYTNIGPEARDGAIMLEKLKDFDRLARGFHETIAGGSYSLHEVDESFFQYTVGPQSFKKFLHPPRRKLWSSEGSKTSFRIIENNDEPPKMAFWGIRSCDLSAIHILDRIFLQGDFPNLWYQQARKDLFVIAVACTRPSENCFCSSTNTGPTPDTGFDFLITEILSEKDHFFLVRCGSALADSFAKKLDLKEALPQDIEAAEAEVSKAESGMRKRFDPVAAAKTIRDNPEHPHWEDIASKCLSCGNCTMVCPTCFCTTTEDITDITGNHSERWLQWDSCFNGAFSYIHGGTVRPTTRSRYRQWVSHKLSNWYDQFGSSGCVGCGRCITWCPVGIDLTKEVQALGNPAKKIKDENH